ncbi:hypothetical protein C8J57DRAFT_1212032 [Mycena rebaudengoi]|nr:hypothetical protein C8J57DRAFT_1212032 [Mycena rebaudengoi]
MANTQGAVNTGLEFPRVEGGHIHICGGFFGWIQVGVIIVVSGIEVVGPGEARTKRGKETEVFLLHSLGLSPTKEAEIIENYSAPTEEDRCSSRNRPMIYRIQQSRDFRDNMATTVTLPLYSRRLIIATSTGSPPLNIYPLLTYRFQKPRSIKTPSKERNILNTVKTPSDEHTYEQLGTVLVATERPQQ